MPLNLYRRHSRRPGKCLGGHPPDFHSYEAEELRRRFRGCACPIYADGTLGGNFRRRNTQQTDWNEARRIAQQREAAGNWDGWKTAAPLAPDPPSPPLAEQRRNCVTIERAAEAYLANREARQIAHSTLRKYRTMVTRLRAFAESRGYSMLDQFHPLDMDEFYASWRDGIRSKSQEARTAQRVLPLLRQAQVARREPGPRP